MEFDSLDPSTLRKKGSHVQLNPLFNRIPTEAEEAIHLGDQDLASMSSHRFNRTFHRKSSKIEKSTRDSTIGSDQRDQKGQRSQRGQRGQNSHQSWDRTPHELFIELDELNKVGGEYFWREVGRWIKYEQKIEEGSQRWGKPHVSSLSFHSLLELRRGIATGSVMLDVVARDWFELATLIVENLTITVEIPILSFERGQRVKGSMQLEYCIIIGSG